MIEFKLEHFSYNIVGAVIAALISWLLFGYSFIAVFFTVFISMTAVNVFGLMIQIVDYIYLFLYNILK